MTLETLTAVGLPHYLAVSSLLFLIGAIGLVFNRRHVIVIMMAIELMLLSANVNLVAFSHFANDLTGQIFALIVLCVAAAEAAIGLAILVVAFRHRGGIGVDEFTEMKG